MFRPQEDTALALKLAAALDTELVAPTEDKADPGVLSLSGLLETVRGRLMGEVRGRGERETEKAHETQRDIRKVV